MISFLVDQPSMCWKQGVWNQTVFWDNLGIEAYHFGNNLGILETKLFNHFQDKFVAQLEIIIRKKKMLTVWIDEQWVSEKEMKDDLKWSPSFGFNQNNFALSTRCITHSMYIVDIYIYIYIDIFIYYIHECLCTSIGSIHVFV